MALVAGLLAACAAPDTSGSRLDAGEIQAAVTSPPVDEAQLDAAEAAAAGFPPLDQIQDPQAVATELFARAEATGTWSVTWQFRDDEGRDGGIFKVSRLADASGVKLVTDGILGEKGTLFYHLRVLDDGAGPRGCLQQDDKPWVCDQGLPDSALQFLTVEGFGQIGVALPGVIAGDSVRVTYVEMAGVATACFTVEPQPLSMRTLGLDFSRSGSFCVSKDGVLMALEAGIVNLRAFEYSLSADPAAFTLPVTT